MENLFFDSGIKEYSINGGSKKLRISPSDPNLYARYVESLDKIKKYETEIQERVKGLNAEDENHSEQIVLIMRDYDLKMKSVLDDVFGCGNDFDDIFEGINLLALASNGDIVINNFMEAVRPIIEQGTKDFVASKKAQAKANREQRRAMQK